jgi:carbamoyltransferase
MQKTMNLKIKYRESFRPFAPAVLNEDAADYFELEGTSPYMLIVTNIAETLRLDIESSDKNLFGIDQLNEIRSKVPAITHIDYSARVQTVHEETNSRFHALLKSFKEKTGCSVLVNTSFNVRGEPIVLTPSDSFTCFMRTEMDALVIENFLFLKERQPTFDDDKSWREDFTLD